MFKQLRVPITHTVWSINYSFPVLGAKLPNSTNPLTMLVPQDFCPFLQLTWNMVSYMFQGGHKTLIAELVLFFEGRIFLCPHPRHVCFNMLLPHGYKEPLSTHGTPKLAWHFKESLIVLHC